MSRGSLELLRRNHRDTLPLIKRAVSDLHARDVAAGWYAEREAWGRAVQAQLCLVGLFGMIESNSTRTHGLRGMRTEATKNLSISLQASKTAFPQKEFEILMEHSIQQAINKTVAALAEDLKASNDVNRTDCEAMVRAVEEGVRVSLGDFVHSHF